MTPKEKAIELFDKFIGFKMNPYNDPEMTLTIGIAKSNCLIAVDEIIDILPFDSLRYWQEVKTEIQSL